MECPGCHHPNRVGARFCEQCAAPLGLACAGCGGALSPGARFCPQCARPVGGPSAAGVAGPAAGAAPPPADDRLATGPAALEGERKQVTVLFADLKGSLELLADRDPEEARTLLDPVLRLMMDAVRRYGGTVNQVLGDGIMALFGAPRADEDHALRACHAALALQAAMARPAAGGGPPLQARVGLNSGEVVVRAIPSDLHLDYTAVGQTTHLAARMEQAAVPGTVLLTADTLRLVAGEVEVRPVGPLSVKGLGAPVPAFELLAVRPVPGRLRGPAARTLTAFVGRRAETDRLREALALAGQGAGQVVAVVGEPGVGKSRVCWEFTRSEEVGDWQVLETGAVSYGAVTPYGPVVELLRRYLSVDGRDDSGRVTRRVAERLQALGPALERCAPALLGLLDVPVSEAGWGRLDPPQRREETLDALRRLLLAESGRRPLLLVFEDLHWIDSETQALLDRLVESLPTARLLLLATYRPEYRHGWSHKSYYRQLGVGPLAAPDASRMLAALLGPAPELEGLKRRLLERTDGNPFFVEESVRALVETGVLQGRPGAYHPVRPPGSVQTPPTVQAILAARIDRLPPEVKALLQSASVIGKDVPRPLLQAVTGRSPAALQAGLEALQAAEFLYETRFFPEPEYTFKHALTHEVAYGSLLHEQRRRLHARIVEAIEALEPDRLTEQAERLAHHARAGQVWAAAARYARLAGDRASALCVDDQAVEFYEQALQALARLPATGEAAAQELDVRLALRPPLWRSGRLQRLHEVFQAAEALATRLGSAAALDAVNTFFVQYAWAMGEQPTAIAYGQRCVEAGRARGDLGPQVIGHYYLGHAYHALGAYRRSLEHLEAILALLEGSRQAERFGMSGLPYCSACALGAADLTYLGAGPAALALLDRGAAVARAADHLYSRTVLEVRRGEVLITFGTPAEAAAVLEPAVAACRDKGFAGASMSALLWLAHAHALAGRPAEGLPLLEEAIALKERTGSRVEFALLYYPLADACRRLGRLDEAVAAAGRMLEFARRHGERGTEGYGLVVLGEVRAEAGDTAGAASTLKQAMALADELAMVPLQGRCHLALAGVCRRGGDDGRAREHRTRAAEIFRAAGMPFWLALAGG